MSTYVYGFDQIVYAKILIPGQTDLLSLVCSSFDTADGVDPIEVEGEIRNYNALADTNADGSSDGWDHAAACFIGEDGVYDIESFEYDENGNRIKLMQNGDQYRYTYGERNRLETIHRKKKDETAESLYVAYDYDNCGNTTMRTIFKDEGEEVIVFEYDTMNRLVKTTVDTDVTEYFYDNAGNRFIKISPDGTTVYLRHGQIAVAMDIELPMDTTEELGRTNRYVLSGDLLAGRITKIVSAVGDPTVEKSYYHLDHLNSTKCVTDGSGILVVMYEYRAFGEQLKRLDSNGDETDDSAKYSYGGKELDDGTNLYYFNARYYDATIGRFINVDPMQDGSNWYVYCRNNPLRFIDATGLKEELITLNSDAYVGIENDKGEIGWEMKSKGTQIDANSYIAVPAGEKIEIQYKDTTMLLSGYSTYGERTNIFSTVNIQETYERAMKVLSEQHSDLSTKATRDGFVFGIGAGVVSAGVSLAVAIGTAGASIPVQVALLSSAASTVGGTMIGSGINIKYSQLSLYHSELSSYYNRMADKEEKLIKSNFAKGGKYVSAATSAKNLSFINDLYQSFSNFYQPIKDKRDYEREHTEYHNGYAHIK